MRARVLQMVGKSIERAKRKDQSRNISRADRSNKAGGAFGNQMISQDSSINAGYSASFAGSMDDRPKKVDKNLSQFVTKMMPETVMEKPLTQEEIDQIPGIREKLGKQPGEPIFQRELFKLIVSRAMQKKD